MFHRSMLKHAYEWIRFIVFTINMFKQIYYRE